MELTSPSLGVEHPLASMTTVAASAMRRKARVAFIESARRG
jgi:hypothetical protein